MHALPEDILPVFDQIIMTAWKDYGYIRVILTKGEPNSNLGLRDEPRSQ